MNAIVEYSKYGGRAKNKIEKETGENGERNKRVRVAERSTAVAKHTFARTETSSYILFHLFFPIWRSKDQQ